MSDPPKYQAEPAQFNLPPEVGTLIHQLYVVEEKSMTDALRITQMRTGLKFSPDNGKAFIRANGWKRSLSFYAQKSRWTGLARAAHEERKAKDRAAGHG